MRLDRNDIQNAWYMNNEFALAMLNQNNKYKINLDSIQSLYDSTLKYSCWMYLGVGIGSAYVIFALLIKCVCVVCCGSGSNKHLNNGII